jgi:hypothetical protein
VTTLVRPICAVCDGRGFIVVQPSP